MESVRCKQERKREELNTDSEDKYMQAMVELELLRREKEERERELEQRNEELTIRVSMLEAEMKAMSEELEITVDANRALELEIMTYRCTLEGEENRSDLRQITDSILNSGKTNECTIRHMESTSGDNSATLSQSMDGISARTTYLKSAKGPIGFAECSADGEYVSLENNGRRDEALGNWSLTRSIDGKDSVTYKFDDSFILRPSQKVKVWSKGKRPSSESEATGDIELDQTWGVGAHIITKLFNPVGEERAYLTQSTIYT